MAMVLGSPSRGGGAARAISGYRSTMLLRLRPLPRAVLLSHSAGSLYGGMLRVSALVGGAARSWPPVLGAGPGSVGGAMSLCAQPRCGTHMPPWFSWWVLNHQIHASIRLSVICPGADKRLELQHKDVGCCGVQQGDHCEEPVRVDVLEVFREGCHQPAGGCGGVDAVERPQRRQRGPVFLRCVCRGGGGGMFSQSLSGVAPVGEGCPGVVPGCPPGTFPVEGSCCWGIEQAAAVGSESPDS